jgi:hypothetical protein
MMMRTLLALAVLSICARCATVAHGRYQEVPVNSTPAGAAVTIDCGNGLQSSGVTPVTVKLKRNADKCALTLVHDGYEDASATFAKAISGWIWGNLAIGGIPGWIIDAADGAMYNRVPESVQINMTKK